VTGDPEIVGGRFALFEPGGVPVPPDLLSDAPPKHALVNAATKAITTGCQ
jgi:hypothetical protein